MAITVLDPHATNRRHRPRKTLKERVYTALLIFFVTLGFGYQAILICNDYFRYPTSTVVTILGALPVTVPPRVAIRIPFPPDKGMSLKDYFEDFDDKTRFVYGTARRAYIGSNSNAAMDGRFMNLKKFLSEVFYYLLVRPKDQIELVPEELYAFNQALYTAVLRTNLVIFGERNYGGEHFFMTSYHGDMEGVQRTPLKIHCPKDKITCSVTSTYSIKVTKLAPPPYDTNCRDYNGTQYTSSDNCLSSCLNEFLKEHGFILESSVIERDKYENSTLRLVPFYFKSLKYSSKNYKGDVTAPWIKSYEYDDLVETFKSRSWKLPQWKHDYWKNLIKIFPTYKKHWTQCRNFCNRPDCHTESVVPQLISIKGSNNAWDTKNASSLKPMSFLSITVFPPRDQIITVVSVGKNNLLDFIVYILSCLSFWYGFCPLSAANHGKVNDGYKKAKQVAKRIDLLSKVVAKVMAITDEKKNGDGTRRAGEKWAKKRTMRGIP